MDGIVICSGCIQRDRRLGELLKDNARLRAENTRLHTENTRLRAQLDNTERGNQRQAAPFSKGPPKDLARSTARPRGAAYGKHGHRPPPAHDQIDHTFEAPWPERCPDCGGDIVEDEDVDEQFQQEIPIKPMCRLIRIHKGTCRRCGRRVRGRQPGRSDCLDGEEPTCQAKPDR